MGQQSFVQDSIYITTNEEIVYYVYKFLENPEEMLMTTCILMYVTGKLMQKFNIFNDTMV